MNEISKIRVDDVDYDIKDASARQSIEDLTATIEADNETRDATISAQGTAITTANNSISNLNSVLTGAVSDLSGVKTSVEGIGNSISGINAAIDEVEADITGINERLDSIGSGGGSGGSGEPIDVSGLVPDMSVMDAKMFEKFGRGEDDSEYFFSQANWGALQVYNRAYVQCYDGDDDLCLGDGGKGQYALKAICRFGSGKTPRYPWMKKSEWTGEGEPTDTDYPFMGTIAEREPDGSIRVPNATNYFHAVNKGFMEASLNKISTAEGDTTYLVTARRGKDTDASTKAPMSAATRMTQGAASETGYTSDYSSIASTVPTRTAKGNLRSGTPVTSNDVAPRRYVDDAKQELLTQINGVKSDLDKIDISGDFVPVGTVSDTNRYVYSATKKADGSTQSDLTVKIAKNPIYSGGQFEETVVRRQSTNGAIHAGNPSQPSDAASLDIVRKLSPNSGNAIASSLNSLNILMRYYYSTITGNTANWINEKTEFVAHDSDYVTTAYGTTNNPEQVIIGDTYNQFSGVSHVYGVEYPSDASLRSNAFRNKSKLKTFCFLGARPNDAKMASYIGKQAFMGSTSLRTVILGSHETSTYYDKYGVELIEEGAFNSCYNLSTFIADEHLYTIGNAAFEYCKNLANVEFPYSLQFIGSYAFHASGLLSVTLREVQRIDDAAFAECENLMEARVKSSYIGESAFSGCHNLRVVQLYNSPTAYSDYTTIHQSAFERCNNLTDIYVTWAQNAVPGAPWGATKATIHYNWISEV